LRFNHSTLSPVLQSEKKKAIAPQNSIFFFYSAFLLKSLMQFCGYYAQNEFFNSTIII